MGRDTCRFYSDNEAVVTVIRKRCANNRLLTNLLRCLFFYAVVYKFHFSASHIPGESNWVADAISRNNLSSVSSFLPQGSETTVPQSIVHPQFLMDLPDWGSRNWMEQFTHSLASPHPPTVGTGPAFVVTRRSAQDTNCMAFF